MEKEVGKIYQAMANIYTKIEAIKKNQKNEQQGFKFRGIDDIYNSLHRIFGEEGVFVIPKRLESRREEIVSKSGSKGFSTVSTIQFDFYSVDGSSVSSIVDGEGADYGDKSTSKSQSMAIKYLLLQVFMIPTEDMVDGDKETIAEMRSNKKDKLSIEEQATMCDIIENIKTLEELTEYYNECLATVEKESFETLLLSFKKRKKELSVK